MGFADTWELVGNHTTNTINIYSICGMILFNIYSVFFQHNQLYDNPIHE